MEIKKKQEILRILTGNGNPEKMRNDAEHIFEAHKYGGRYFVTVDKRILKKRNELAKIGVSCVMRPSELLALAEEFLEETGPRPSPGR